MGISLVLNSADCKRQKLAYLIYNHYYIYSLCSAWQRHLKWEKSVTVGEGVVIFLFNYEAGGTIRGIM